MTQLKELVAMILIGDGVLGTLIPTRHVRRWEVGPKRWRNVLEGAPPVRERGQEVRHPVGAARHHSAAAPADQLAEGAVQGSSARGRGVEGHPAVGADEVRGVARPP